MYEADTRARNREKTIPSLLIRTVCCHYASPIVCPPRTLRAAAPAAVRLFLLRRVQPSVAADCKDAAVGDQLAAASVGVAASVVAVGVAASVVAAGVAAIVVAVGFASTAAAGDGFAPAQVGGAVRVSSAAAAAGRFAAVVAFHQAQPQESYSSA